MRAMQITRSQNSNDSVKFCVYSWPRARLPFNQKLQFCRGGVPKITPRKDAQARFAAVRLTRGIKLTLIAALLFCVSDELN
jgi:hypothetical protein